MNLADELIGVVPRRRIVTGAKRRLFCVDDDVDVRAEQKRLRKLAYMHEYHKKNPEKNRARGKAWREKNKERDAARKRAWRKKNLDYYRAYNAQRARANARKNREKKNAAAKLYREKFRDAINARQRAYRLANRDRLNAAKREANRLKKRRALRNAA